MKIFADSDPTYNPVNEFFKNYGMWIAIAFASLILTALLVLFFIAFKKKGKSEASSKSKIETTLNNGSFLLALGGEDNILSFSNNGSRLSIELKNYDLIDENKLNEMGVNSIIKMSNKVVLVIKNNMSTFVDILKS